MKNLLLPIYIILAVLITINLFDTAMESTTDKHIFLAYAFFSAVITALMTKRLLNKLRIF